MSDRRIRRTSVSGARGPTTVTVIVDPWGDKLDPQRKQNNNPCGIQLSRDMNDAVVNRSRGDSVEDVR